MRRIMIVLSAAVICGLLSAQTVQAMEKNADLRQDVIQLCFANAVLADKLNAIMDKEEAALNRFGRPRAFYDQQTGRELGRIPTSLFFLMVADLVRRDQKIDSEVVGELLKDNQMFLKALEHGDGQRFTDERVK